MSVVLHGRYALVTGGSRGIGLASARVLAANGARLALVARGAAALEAAALELGALALPCDLADAAAVASLPARLAGAAPDIVVHAAGAFELAAIPATAPEMFDRVLSVNLRAAFLLMRAFLPGMLGRGAGDFVSIGSVAGRAAFPHNGAYAASKFGLRGLHAVLEQELRGTGVRATLVEPAATDTPLWDAIDAAAHPGLRPRADMLRPEAVADAVLFALTRPPGAAVHNIILDRN